MRSSEVFYLLLAIVSTCSAYNSRSQFIASTDFGSNKYSAFENLRRASPVEFGNAHLPSTASSTQFKVEPFQPMHRFAEPSFVSIPSWQTKISTPHIVHDIPRQLPQVHVHPPSYVQSSHAQYLGTERVVGQNPAVDTDNGIPTRVMNAAQGATLGAFEGAVGGLFTGGAPGMVRGAVRGAVVGGIEGATSGGKND